MSHADPNCPSEKTVTVGEQEVIFTDRDSNLLSCLEAANVAVEYHCRDGYCGACRVTLNKGQVKYPQGEPLAFVGDNEILPCCCIPHSDIDITIE